MSGRRKLLLGALCLVLPLVIYASVREGMSRLGREERLAVRWEGIWIPNNFRDVGASMNSCLGREDFKEGVLTRSNVWFSGWSCDGIGDPDVILSLNRNQKRHEQYYCRMSSGEEKIGRHFQSDDLVLHNLEFFETWSDPRMADTACAFFRDGFNEIIAGKKVLVHCDAGKDRTGTYAALTSALMAEYWGKLDDRMLDAIECDYQKSRNLEKEKYGRMRAFILDLQSKGGVAAFLADKCQIDQGRVAALSERLRASL